MARRSRTEESVSGAADTPNEQPYQARPTQVVPPEGGLRMPADFVRDAEGARMKAAAA